MMAQVPSHYLELRQPFTILFDNCTTLRLNLLGFLSKNKPNNIMDAYALSLTEMPDPEQRASGHFLACCGTEQAK